MGTNIHQDTAISAVKGKQSVSEGYFYIGIVLYMIGIAIVGFWNTYFGPFFYGTLNSHWLIDVHVVVFSTWLVLFLGQAILANKKQIRSHQKLGTNFGIPWGILLLIIGFFVTFAVITPGVGKDHEAATYAVPLLASLGDLIAFGGLFVAAVLYRKRPPIHKRLMVLATASLMEAPVARIALEVGGAKGFGILWLVSLSPVFIAMGYDRWRRGQVHPVYWIGLGVLVLKLSRFFFAESDLWLSTASWLTENVYPLIDSLL